MRTDGRFEFNKNGQRYANGRGLAALCVCTAYPKYFRIEELEFALWWFAVYGGIMFSEDPPGRGWGGWFGYRPSAHSSLLGPSPPTFWPTSTPRPEQWEPNSIFCQTPHTRAGPDCSYMTIFVFVEIKID